MILAGINEGEILAVTVVDYPKPLKLEDGWDFKANDRTGLIYAENKAQKIKLALNYLHIKVLKLKVKDV